MSNDSDSSNATNAGDDFSADDGNQPTLPPRPSSHSSNDETLIPSQSPPQPSGKLSRREFGDYVLQDEIARGGMGVVYRARQKSLNREVAIKMILAGQFASQEEVDRFYAEATAAANLDHPNIVPVYDVGEIESNHFFSMKLIEGSDLGTRLSELRNDLPAAIRILQKVCDAVHHAHQRGVLHRDLKPGNVLLDKDDQPYVTDFGLARRFDEDSRITRTGAVIGTPSYMPPEQAAGNTDITTAADIYSLGAILYEVLCGRPPFKGSSPVETLMQVINELPERPSLSGITDRGLESICMKCLAKEPSDRYASAAELSRDLGCWLNGEPISVRATSLTNATKFWLKQNFGSVIWAIVIGPIFGIVSSLSLWYSTIGLDTSNMVGSYARLPSARIPFSLSPSSIPQSAQVPLIILFLLSIVFIGFVTARYVKPKHRGADLAAGAVVGLFASITAFMFALGPLCVLSTLKYNDLKYSIQIALAEEDVTPAWVLEEYPELKGMNRNEQVKSLADKTEADHFYQIPAGLWAGMFVSLAIYFFPCLFETAVAGPILRRRHSWFRSLLAYLETAFPVVTLMVVVALFLTTWVVLGGAGFRWSIRLFALLLFIVLAIVAGQMRWKVPVRAVIQGFFALSFVWFFATDFPAIPGVSDCNRRLSAAQYQVKQKPDDYSANLKLVMAQASYAEMLTHFERIPEAISFMDRAISQIDGMAAAANREELVNADKGTIEATQMDCRLKKALLLDRMGRRAEAMDYLEAVKKQFPENRKIDGFIDELRKIDGTNKS